MMDAAPGAPRPLPARRARSVLFWVLVISAGVHVLGAVIVGSWTIYRYARPPEATFESPPPPVKIPPRAVEYRVQMQQMQKQSARPRNQVAAQVDSLLRQDLQSIMSNVAASVTPALAGAPVLSGRAGAGGGRIGGGALGFGVSAVDFFGIKKQGERVVFIVDAGGSMVAPERGDLPGYDRVKHEVATMVQALSPGTFFNIIVFERAIDVFAPALVVATADHTGRVEDWLGPYWRLKNGKIEQRGTFRKNYEPKMEGWPDDGGASRLDLALIAAMEMGADLLFVITDGTPSIQRGRDPAADARWRQAKDGHSQARAAYEKSEKGRREMAAYEIKRAAWRARQNQINEDRRRRGLPPVVREGAVAGAPRRPGPAVPREPVTYYTGEDLIRYARNRARDLYAGSSGGRLPGVNLVGYSADKRGQEFIAALARVFPGSSARNIGRFDENTRH